MSLNNNVHKIRESTVTSLLSNNLHAISSKSLFAKTLASSFSVARRSWIGSISFRVSAPERSLDSSCSLSEIVLWWCRAGGGCRWWCRWWWWWWWWWDFFSPPSFWSFCTLWPLWSTLWTLWSTLRSRWWRLWCRCLCFPSSTYFKTSWFSFPSSKWSWDSWSSLIFGRTRIPSRDRLLCSFAPPSVLSSFAKFRPREWILFKGSWKLVDDTRRPKQNTLDQSNFRLKRA